jgi:hypothetical protein
LGGQAAKKFPIEKKNFWQKLIGRPVHLKKVTFAQFEGEHMPML